MRIAAALIALALAACPAPPKKPPEPAPLVDASSAGEPTPAVKVVACVTPPGTETSEEPAQDPLAELSALEDEIIAGGPDAGGSIRAKREPPVDRVRADPCRLRARVELVVRGRFPVAAVRVRVLQPPTEGPGAELKKNDDIVVLPRLAVARGRALMHDRATLRNAGAFYLSKGDRVHLRLAEKRADGVWWVEAIARD